MELEDLKNFVNGADEQQLKAFAFMASWLGDMGPKYCTCSVQCNKDCEVVKAMGHAFMAAAQRL